MTLRIGKYTIHQEGDTIIVSNPDGTMAWADRSILDAISWAKGHQDE